MHHVIFKEKPSYDVALLIRKQALYKEQLEEHYVEPLREKGVDSVIGFSLEYYDKNKPTSKEQKEYLATLLPELDKLGVTTLLVADSAYFKTLTKIQKVESQYGYVRACAIKGFEHFNIALTINYKALFYNPTLFNKLALSINAVAAHLQGNLVQLGEAIIHSEYYPDTMDDIYEALEKLHEYDALTCDIEGFSLNPFEAGIGSISFAWDKHNGIAFLCDYTPHPHRGFDNKIREGIHRDNQTLKALLTDFFIKYQGKLIYHNQNFDCKILTYELFMEEPLDHKGLIKGADVFTRNSDCTKIISYLATNSCSGNTLSLKHQAHEYAGNYAQDDIKDICLIESKKLLRYNLYDCLATWYVYEKNMPRLIADNQESVYEKVFKPSVKTLIHMELTGLPLDMMEVITVDAQLSEKHNKIINSIYGSSIIKAFSLQLRKEEMLKKNLLLKTKVKPLEDFDHISFNPNSYPNLQRLLYEEMALPVLDYTKKKQPATGADALKKLLHQTQDKGFLKLLNSLIDNTEIAKIRSAFIPAFRKAKSKDNHHYLHGNFNLGGTVSGRMSSSNINLQQLPSTGTKYAKPIKKCFQAPKGWLFVGADFASLEDRISALTTKDPNKIKVYLDNYDGHCLRAYYYFREQMPDIVETVESINSIKQKYPDLRQLSKAPTFLLTYGGTYIGLETNCGFSKEDALKIEANYHQLYVASDEWVKAKLDEAAKVGYVECAFGLRVRTPLLKQTLRSNSSSPYEAAAEARTAGNALGQSYGLLNNRAANEFLDKVLASPYALDIRICAQIHDAIYLMVRDNIEVVEWVNKNLIECMSWQELDEIKHDEVKLGGELSIFYPDWSNEIVIPNNATQTEIENICNKHMEK
jgi:DNA polymerase-1